ncbi:hypothetical protein MRX96_029214 [Rhipicephalus microplus]
MRAPRRTSGVFDLVGTNAARRPACPLGCTWCVCTTRAAPLNRVSVRTMQRVVWNGRSSAGPAHADRLVKSGPQVRSHRRERACNRGASPVLSGERILLFASSA